MAAKKTTSVTHGMGHGTTRNLSMGGMKAGKIVRSANPPQAGKKTPHRVKGAVATILKTGGQRGGFPKK